MHIGNGTRPNGWLAFELGVLRRLKFSSASIPFTGEPDLGVHLKRWGVRVAANDLEKWSATKSEAFIANNTERLSEDDVARVLEDAYVPRHKLHNRALLKWFNETDAWWIDNVRENAENLEKPASRALALSYGMMVGDYVRSFDDSTRELRQPLSKVFRRIWQSHLTPYDNSKANSSDNREAREFVAEQQTNLLILRLPIGAGSPGRENFSNSAWREEWIRGGDGFWDELKKARVGRLGMGVVTKQQYLRFVEDLLRVALHFPAWAIAHVEDGFVPANDLVETINAIRKVETVYTKDFSELTGLRATIITAT